MNSKYLSTPENISRFIEMSARSLSPQREISQMTAQLHRPQRKTSRDADTVGQGTIEYEYLIDQMGRSGKTIVESTAHLLQCGSPLYDPVKKGWKCWNGHDLRIKERAQYGLVDGVSCDFCGFTDWSEEAQSGKKESARGRKRGRKRVNKKESLYLYHCDVCGMDLCTHCAKELRDDNRYYVPCMQCRHCLVFMRDEESVLHRCYVKQARDTSKFMTPSLSSASGGASSSSRVESIVLHGSSPSSSVTPAAPPAPAAAPSFPHSSFPFAGGEWAASSPQRPDTVWEVCVTFKTALEHAKACLIAGPLAMEDLETPEVGGQLIFRMPTRLAAEDLLQRFHDAHLFSSLRRFRV